MDIVCAILRNAPDSRRAVPLDSPVMAKDAARTGVFLVEDSRPICARLTNMLAAIENVDIVGDAATPDSAIEGIARTHPDCVVLDLQLRGGSGIEVLRKVRPAEPGIVFIVLTNMIEPQYRDICMRNGASYFFDKSSEFEKVKEVVARLGTRL